MSTDKKQWFNTVYPWLIWTMGAGFFFYKYLVQVSPSVMTNELMTTFQVSGTGLGNLSAFYFYSYLIMQIPVGIMLDKYSPRLLTTLAILICSIGTFLFAQTHDLWMACLSRALIGFGAAFAAVSSFKLAAMWFNPKRFALVSGLFMTAAMMGAVGGEMPLSLLVQHMGWRMALQLIGVMGIILGIIYFAVVRDKKTMLTHSGQSMPTESGFVRIMSSKQAWLLSFYSGLAYAPFSVFGGLWGVPFLETAYHLSPTDAALAVSCIFVGFAIGAPVLGWLSDFMGRRKPILFIGTTISLFCLLVVIYFPHPSLAFLMVVLFIFGFCISGFVTSFAMIRELFPIVLSATAIGIMNTFNSLCEALFEPLIGGVLDWTWAGEIANGVHQFSVYSYKVSLFLLPVTLILSLICLCFIRETYCHTND